MTKSLTTISTITNYDPYSDKIIKKYIEELKLTMGIIYGYEYDYNIHNYFIFIYLNGMLTGMIDPNFASQFYYLMKEKKKQEINKYASIIFDSDKNEIQINTQKGRLVRPVLCVDKKIFHLELKKEMIQEIKEKKL